jgi:hypothetical protein
LLLWVIGAFAWLMPTTLQAILRLSATTKSLIPLEKLIEDRYSCLFSLEEGDNGMVVKMKSDDIERYLVDRDKEATESKENEEQATGGFEAAEIALIKRIIKTHFNNIFGGPEMFDKYKFDSFFDSKMEVTSVKVHYQSKDLHLKILRECLVAICEKTEEPDFSTLRGYA